MRRPVRFAIRVAALLAAPLGAFAAPPSNVLVNNPAADATQQDTQTVSTVVRTGASSAVAAFADSGSFLAGAMKFTGFARTTDNGATWTDMGTLPTSASGDVAQPALARDSASGLIYLSTLSFDSNVVQVFRSTDGGATFAVPVNGAPGSSLADEPTVAVVNGAGPYTGRVLLAYRDYGGAQGMRLHRSTDSGSTWSAPLPVTTGTGQGAALTVSPDHTIGYWYLLDGSPSSIRLQRSTDGGVTFAAATVVTNLVTTAVNGNLGVGTYRTNAFPHPTVHPLTGQLYVAYNDAAVPAGGDRGNILFRHSTDGGTSWAGAVKLNDDGTSRAQFHPSMAVTPDGDHLLVAWYDRRNDPSDVLLEYWGVIGTISGSTVTFGRNFRISSAAFAPVNGVDPVVNTTYMSDYEGMAADADGFDVTWGDGRDDATFFGAARKNMNVRYSRIPTPIRGDVNSDFTVSVADVFHLINALFAAGPAPVSPCQGDADANGTVNVADVFYLINYLFAGGPAPAPPC